MDFGHWNVQISCGSENQFALLMLDLADTLLCKKIKTGA